MLADTSADHTAAAGSAGAERRRARAAQRGIVVDGWLVVEGERVLDVGAGAPPDAPVSGVPGAGRARVRGRARPRRRRGVVRRRRPRRGGARVVRTHLAHGTTTMVASLVTDRSTRSRRVRAARRPASTTGLVAGIHLEGPWLRPAGRRARPCAARRRRAAGESTRLVEAGARPPADGHPGPRAARRADAERRLVAAGVVAAVGHTDATYDETRAALEAGRHASAPTCSTPCGRCTTASPGRSAALLEHLGATSSWSPTACTSTRGARAGRRDGRDRAGHRRDGGRRGRATATTCSARCPSVRDGVARLAARARSPARPRRWPPRCGSRSDGRRSAAGGAGGRHLDAGRDARAGRGRGLAPGSYADLVVLVRRPRGRTASCAEEPGSAYLSGWLRTSWWWTTTTPTRGTWSTSSRR